MLVWCYPNISDITDPCFADSTSLVLFHMMPLIFSGYLWLTSQGEQKQLTLRFFACISTTSQNFSLIFCRLKGKSYLHLTAKFQKFMSHRTKNISLLVFCGDLAEILAENPLGFLFLTHPVQFWTYLVWISHKWFSCPWKHLFTKKKQLSKVNKS